MAISTDKIKKKKKDYNPEPAQKMPSMKPFGKKAKSIQRNPHRDSGDKKPSLKTKASIIKDKAKKGQGLARGGMVKSVIKLIPRFARTPKSGTISTIDPVKRAASAFVQRRKQLGGAKALDPVKKAMGGQASESVARSRIFADKKARDRQRLMDMLDRLKKKPGGAGKPKIIPKKKPRKDPKTGKK